MRPIALLTFVFLSLGLLHSVDVATAWAAPEDDPFDFQVGKAVFVEVRRELDVFLDQFGDVGNGRPWGPEQATGPPDTPGAGDKQSAWASLTQNAQDEWLELKYDRAVVPSEVVIHETFNPGAVFKVTLIANDEEEVVVWQGDDPTAVGEARGVSRIKLDTQLETDRIRIHLKSTEVPGWNEIDAVGLLGVNAKLQWATDAKASSTYAEQNRGIILPQASRDNDLVQQRERQLAKLIKKLRETHHDVAHLQERLRASQAEIERLRKENQLLRSQLEP